MTRARAGAAAPYDEGGNSIRSGTRSAVVIGLAWTLLSASPARALCIYHGALYAKTTLNQEFADAEWVVRARVTSADYHWSDDDPWTLYHLTTVRRFKGDLNRDFTLFTERNSGAFYLEDRRGHPDISRDYLLFLDPVDPSHPTPRAARGALEVNYNCGRSRAWPDVSRDDTRQLQALAGQP